MWQDLGGTVFGTPAVTYQGTGNRYDVFAPGSTGQMYQKSFQNGAWTSWFSIGGANVAAGAHAVIDSAGAFHVFAISSDHHLNQAIYAGSSWVWQDLGGTVFGTPAVTYQGTGNRYDVFAPGSTGQMYQKSFQNGAWTSWFSIGGANLAAGAEVVLTLGGTYHLFTVNSNGQLTQGVYNGTWVWQTLDGAVAGTPGVTYSDSTNRYDVFAPGRTGQMYQKSYQNGAWTSWFSIGGANFG